MRYKIISVEAKQNDPSVYQLGVVSVENENQGPDEFDQQILKMKQDLGNSDEAEHAAKVFKSMGPIMNKLNSSNLFDIPPQIRLEIDSQIYQEQQLNVGSIIEVDIQKAKEQ